MSEQPLSILVIDDDDVAVEAVSRAISRQDIPLELVAAADGVDAIRVLRGQDSHRSIRSPLVILLDLNMIGMSGLEFLATLRRDPALAHHVVFVWTTSDNPADREAAYAHHVAGYMLKSSSDRRHVYLTGLLQLYHDHVKLPC